MTKKEINMNNYISNNNIHHSIIKVLNYTASYSEIPEMQSLIRVKKKYCKFLKAHKENLIK